MCHGGCGVLVYVEKDKVVNIKGDPDSPLNKGKLCIKGLSSLEHLYNPKRLKYPLKRAGNKGEGKWKRISWDQALDEIVENINKIKDIYGIESIVIGQGTGRHHYNHTIAFANALGTPNWINPGEAQCFTPRLLSSVITYGGLPVCDYYGEVSPACMLVWGHNPLVSGPDGEIQFKVRECLKHLNHLIVVDPRKTEMAERASLWLQVRPGTDDALALSMLHVIINEELYDKEFVEKWTAGFDKLSEGIQTYTPEWAEKITWIKAGDIRKAARLFATAGPAVLEWGVAIEQTPNCLQTVRAVSLLPAVTGNIDVPGGWILGMNITPEVSALSKRLPEQVRKKRLGADKFKVLCGPNSLWPSAHISTVFDAMITGKPYPVTSLLNFGNNGLLTYANSKRFYQALTALDFYMAMDIYMTPTAELADIVLPAATWLELDELVIVPYGAPHVVLAQQQITRLRESRSDEEVFIDLAGRLNIDLGYRSVEEALNIQLKETAATYKEFAGLTFGELKNKGYISVPVRYGKYRDNGFRTASGKVELYSRYLEDLGYSPLPYYEEPPESPLSSPGLYNEYPLVLTTGSRSRFFFHSEFRQVPSLREKEPEPVVEIHPETAKKYGTADGDWVWIESPRGRIKQKARITERIDPRIVNVSHGWWFPEDPAPGYGAWKSNANALTDSDKPFDPALGTYQLRALLCKIYPVTPGEEHPDTPDKKEKPGTGKPPGKLSIDFNI